MVSPAALLVAAASVKLASSQDAAPVACANTKIAAGLYHTCLVASDGGVLCYGRDGEGAYVAATRALSYVRVCVPVSIDSLSVDVGARDFYENA